MTFKMDKPFVTTYRPELNDELINFMISQYPDRSKEYLKWWLDGVNNGGEKTWERTKIVFLGSRIVGCMTAKEETFYIDDVASEIFYEANTIVSKNMRGRGIGKLLYDELGKYIDRCTIGMTKASYQIETSRFTNNTVLHPVNVYIGINRWAGEALIKRMFRVTTKKALVSPECIKSGKYNFIKLNEFSDLNIPENGKWMQEDIEVCRSKEWLEKRFVDIWRSTDYIAYSINLNDKEVGYVVFRKAVLYNIEMISIVDYRCTSIEYEDIIFEGARRLAILNRVGFTICLTSRIYKQFRLGPLVIKTPKLIKGLAGPIITKGDILFTSGDSDLDFVYYK